MRQMAETDITIHVPYAETYIPNPYVFRTEAIFEVVRDDSSELIFINLYCPHLNETWLAPYCWQIVPIGN